MARGAELEGAQASVPGCNFTSRAEQAARTSGYQETALNFRAAAALREIVTGNTDLA